MGSPVQPSMGVSQEERFHLLLQVPRNLGAIREPEKLIRALAREIRPLLAFDYLSLFLVDVIGDGPSWHILDVDRQSLLVPTGEIPLDSIRHDWPRLHIEGPGWNATPTSNRS